MMPTIRGLLSKETETSLQRPKRPKISPTMFDEQKRFIETLQAISPHSAILSVSTLRHGPQSNTSVARSLPPTITSFGGAHVRINTRLGSLHMYNFNIAFQSGGAWERGYMAYFKMCGGSIPCRRNRKRDRLLG